MIYHINYTPMFEDGFLLLIKNIHSSTPPPPPPGSTNNVRVCEHNVMQAFPQEQIPHYTTGYMDSNILVIDLNLE